MIQITNKQDNKWHMIIHGVDCVFMPLSLFIRSNLFPEKPNADRGLRWRINRRWVSYNQIKKQIKSYEHRKISKAI